MNLFYHPIAKQGDTEVVFEKEETRHITKVLRHKRGDKVHVTNGKGFFFEAELIDISSKRSTAKVTSEQFQEPLPYRLHIAVAPTKNNDRFEWFLEKATEIGITSITPLLCEHSERKVVKAERLERIIESAMKQSLKAYKPILHPITGFNEFIGSKHEHSLKCIAHCADGETTPFKNLVSESSDILILIGPEGDFSSEEIILAGNHGFSGVSLGSSRLRTETAAIAACHTVSLLK